MTDYRPRIPLLIGVLMAGLATAFSGCDSLLFPTEEFTIRVDSISAPAAIGPDDTLTVRFFGWVGSSGCSRLERVEKALGPGGMQVKFHGERSGSDCTQMPVALEHEERVPPSLQDPFTIKVVQPSGPPLEQVVRIE
jgi:hypothetical protein